MDDGGVGSAVLGDVGNVPVTRLGHVGVVETAALSDDRVVAAAGLGEPRFIVGTALVDERDVAISGLIDIHRAVEQLVEVAVQCCATGLRSEEHTSELQSLMRNSYAVFCLKKKKNKTDQKS